MSKLDKLIQEFCPKGVESLEISKVCKTISTGKQRNRDTLSKVRTPEMQYPVINGGISPSGYTDEFNTKEETITVSQGGASAGFVSFMQEPFWSGAHCYTVEPDDTGAVLNRFLYFFLKDSEKILMDRAMGAGIPGLNRKALISLKIPVPPLEVQKEITSILDKFTQLEAELSAELDARRKQYEYYRNQLLTFSEEGEVRWTTLGEVAIKISSGGTPKTSVASYYGGEIPWLRTQEVDFKEIWDTGLKITDSGLKNSSAKLIPKDCVIIAMYGATVGKSAINKIPLSTNQACANIQVNPEIADYRYVFHWVNHNYKNIKALGTGSQTNINAQTVRNFKIPVPAISEQKRIVSILDKFDNLVNDKNAGLPAEINGRRLQYEYYRTKLLAFQELSV